jgi:surface protein
MFYACSVLEELDLSGWDMPNMVTTTHMFTDCTNLRSVDFTGWNTPSMVSMDAMFNDCHSLTYLDLSSFDTGNCHEFSQMFERCYSLTKIDGLDKWDTRNARTYEELFYDCSSLKEVDLSTFYTRDVVNDFVMEWKGTGWGFLRMFQGAKSLEKMTLSADFSFDGDGKVTTDSYKVSLPSPAAKEGFIAKWRNVETGVLYDASEIPEETAATYVAHYEPIATNP